MDIGFPACGYLLQRYLQRIYKEIYKFTHTRERTQAQARTRERNAHKAIRPHRPHKVSPRKGGTGFASLTPQGRQAPLKNAQGAFFHPRRGSCTPPLKNGTTCPFLPGSPPRGLPPPGKPAPPAGLSFKNRNFYGLGSLPFLRLLVKGEIFLRTG